MTIDELIASGLLEAYVLGNLDEDGVRMVEHMRAKHQRVRDELHEIELGLEHLAMEQAVEPSKSVIEDLLKRIRNERMSPSVVPRPHPFAQGKTVNRSFVLHRWLAAAVLIGLLLSAGMNVLMFWKLNGAGAELARTENERMKLTQDLRVERSTHSTPSEMLAAISDPNAELIFLKGTENAPQAMAKLYWDRNGSNIHICMFALPEPPAGNQYQLWAIVNGQPVDAGLVVLNKNASALIQITQITDAQAFAVTLEPAGGVATPTMETMVLHGKV